MKKAEKNSWFKAGAYILEIDGFSKLTIDRLCSELKLTKGSFYHHFGNMDGYITALMEYWQECHTMEYIRKTDEIPSDSDRLEFISEMVIDSSYRVEQVIRAWSFSNDIVKEYLDKVDKIRIEYIKKLNMEAGMEAIHAERKAILEYAVLVGIQQLYPDAPKTEIKELYHLYKIKNTL